MRYLLAFSVALWCVAGVNAANIVTVADSDPDAPGSANIQSNRPLAVWWSQSQAFTNVTVEAAICFGSSSGSSNIQAFLTTQLGAGTTTAQQVAASGSIVAPINTPNTACPLLTLFSGLSLGPGAYSLSVFAVSGGTASWDFENPFATTSDFGYTPSGFWAAPSTDPYPPASTFTLQIFGPGFFRVTGEPLTVNAANIVTVADSDPDAPGSANIQSNRPLAVSWSQSQAFTNVTVEAAICFGSSSGSSNIQAFLTTQLGAGTTTAQQVAASGSIVAPINTPNTACPYLTLFTGLNLGPGTYHLSVFAVSGGTASWDFENPFATTSDFGYTPSGFWAAPSADPYPPASTFTLQTFGPGFFRVADEPLTVAEVPALGRAGKLALLAAIASVGLFLLRRST